MPREVQDISEGELAIMNVLWDKGRQSIRQITDVVYPGGGNVQYATIQKQLERLEAKSFVHRDRSLYVHVFSPAVDRHELIGRRLQAVADKLCGGSLAPILSHLARAQRLTSKQRAALRTLVDELGLNDKRGSGGKE